MNSGPGFLTNSSFNASDPFGPQQPHVQHQQISTQQITQTGFSSSNPFGGPGGGSSFGGISSSGTGSGASSFTNTNSFMGGGMGLPQGMQQQQQQQGRLITDNPFGAAFDGGNAHKIPHQIGDQTGANAQLANIARNAQQIDPFANLAANNRSTNLDYYYFFSSLYIYM